MLKFQDFSYAGGNRIGKHLVSAGVLVLSGPDAVFILWNSSSGSRLNTAMTTTGGATPGTIEFTDNGIRATYADGSG